MVYTDGQALDDSCVKREWLIGYGEEKTKAHMKSAITASWISVTMSAENGLNPRSPRCSPRAEFPSTARISTSAARKPTITSITPLIPIAPGITENKCVQGHYDYWKYLIGLDQVELRLLRIGRSQTGHRIHETGRFAPPQRLNHNDMIAKQVANYNLCSWIPFVGANSAENRTMVDEYTLRSAYRPALVLQYDPPSQQNR